MKAILQSRLKHLITETDRGRIERLGDKIKDIMEVSPDLFRHVNEQEVKPMVKNAIDKYVYRPDVTNRRQLLHAFDNMGV